MKSSLLPQTPTSLLAPAAGTVSLDVTAAAMLLRLGRYRRGR